MAIGRIRRAFAQSIQLRLSFTFLLILLPLVAISLIANASSRTELKRQLESRTLMSLTSATDYIDLYVKNASDLSATLATDNSLIGLLDDIADETTPQAIVNFTKIVDKISTITVANPLIEEISVLHLPKGMWVSSRYGGIRMTDYADFPWLWETLARRGGSYLFVSRQPLFGNLALAEGRTPNIVLTRMIGFNKSSDPKAVLLLHMRGRAFQDALGALRSSPQSTSYLLDENGQAIASDSGGQPFDMPLPAPGAGVWAKSADGRVTYVVRTEVAASRWSVVMTLPAKDIFAKTAKLTQYTNIIIAISMGMACVISWTVYKSIASPLRRLFGGIKQLTRGNLEMRLPAGRTDDFGKLMLAFNQMAETQRKLIHENYEHQIQLAKTELKMLQSQIKPHFLYNTLDSIYWMSKNYDADDIGEMVVCLSRFFRLNMAKGREVITLGETIDHLHQYVRIQQIRFSNRFSVEYDIAPETRDVPLLKLILQPLVENAILHGLEKQIASGGHLLVCSRLEEDGLHLTVRDSGIGIPPERLTLIRDRLESVRPGAMNSGSAGCAAVDECYGLRSTKLRLLLYYGEACQFGIESETVRGTTVTIVIPLTLPERPNREELA